MKCCTAPEILSAEIGQRFVELEPRAKSRSSVVFIEAKLSATLYERMTSRKFLLSRVTPPKSV